MLHGKIIAIVGFGPGTATAVAEGFGAEGFAVALVGRDEEHLAAVVASLKGSGIDAAAFIGNAGNPASIRAAIGNVQSQMGSTPRCTGARTAALKRATSSPPIAKR